MKSHRDFRERPYSNIDSTDLAARISDYTFSDFADPQVREPCGDRVIGSAKGRENPDETQVRIHAYQVHSQMLRRFHVSKH